ncbi:FMN-dependent NADH-azoreductase, partial [Burkholderia pseudomallei]
YEIHERLVGSGGCHRGERARQADFLTPDLHYALGSIGIRDVQFLLLQGLVAGEAAVGDALDAARAELAGGTVFAKLAAYAAGRAGADATATVLGD